ncbi:DUF488 domain-containing protein [Acidipropionibacterium timonense]|uniref:DUF488 domain-containing protein n=1 Tax=Acidipropionibacterium timonense TaxID=2161818 RepID=UPI0010312A73|nr:DUF488 family protein [Acidipropionibacterium timonense]
MTTFRTANIRDDIRSGSGQAGSGEGLRVLVDRLWPRGVSKDAARLDEVAKDLAPSTELRREFHHGALDFDVFAERYRTELEESPVPADDVARWAGQDVVTLLYGAADREHNHAVVLADHLQRLADES